VIELLGEDSLTLPVTAASARFSMETKSNLLQRLLETRRARLERQELERLKTQGKRTRTDEWNSKYREPAALEEPPSAAIPESWVWVSAETVCESVRDGTHDTPKYVDDGVPLVTSKDLTSGQIDFSKTKNISEADHAEISKRSGVENGDVLFAMIGTIGNPLVVKSDRKFSIKNVGLFKKNDPFLDSRFLKYWLESPLLIKWLIPRLKGTNQKFAPLGLLRSLPIPLAPLDEQHEIVAETEKQFTRLEAGIAGLRRMQANFKRYRAAVLKAACEGKLVPTEAELARQESRSYETGAQLLERILAERRQKWKGKGKYKEPRAPETSSLLVVPKGWTLATAEQLTDETRSITYGVIKLGAPVYDGVPILRSSDVRHLKLDLQDVKRIATDIASQFKRTFLQGSEILVTVRGTLGGVVVVPEDCSGYNISREVAMLSMVEPKIAKPVAIFIGSVNLQRWLLERTKGIAYTGINIETLKQLPIPIPPFAEQERIVAEVERRFSVVEELEAVVNANVQRAARLRQSILQRAFEGSLIDRPQQFIEVSPSILPIAADTPSRYGSRN